MNQEDWHRLNIRIPTEIENKLRKATNKSKRSVTAEIIARLDETFRQDELKETDDKINLKESADRISALAQKISMFADNPKSKADVLSKQEASLLDLFNNLRSSEKSLILSSFPELLSLLKKLS